MTEPRFRDLVRELLDENPFALRPFLKVAGLRFTDEVPTMAMTCRARPELLVNLGFATEHCGADAEVKAVLVHEFLHIILRHTEERGPITPAEHLATDAVINAIIHRQLGSEASAMMSRYYAKSEGLMRLLRPPRPDEIAADGDRVQEAWRALYEGKLIVDDIRELVESMSSGRQGAWRMGGIDIGVLLGNHSELDESLPEALCELVRKSMRSMNGEGIWRSPKDRGVGAFARGTEVGGVPTELRAWEGRALQLLRKHLTPDRKARSRELGSLPSVMPVLSARDRRAFSRALWSPILPLAVWELSVPRPAGSAQVYLDVSGSMGAEMPLLIGLLGRVRAWIRMPFWAFSDEVKPARIVRGRLLTETTGGTSLSSVLAHIAATRPGAAVIVTDGYIERVDPALVAAARGARIHALVTRGGSTLELERAHIPYTQLEEVPK